jgi:hypothetical protein
MIAITPEPVIGASGTLIGMVRNPHFFKFADLWVALRYCFFPRTIKWSLHLKERWTRVYGTKRGCLLGLSNSIAF